MSNSNIPPFFYDSSEGDVTKESLMDFFISWTLRCARPGIKDKNELLFKYSTEILLVLLFTNGKDDNIPEDVKKLKVKDVKTWKQKHRIDLWA